LPEYALPKAISNANPATDGGRTTGRSTSSSRAVLPRKAQRARMYARGIPVATANRVERLLVSRLRRRAERAVGAKV
jgi:hypothetical protein